MNRTTRHLRKGLRSTSGADKKPTDSSLSDNQVALSSDSVLADSTKVVGGEAPSSTEEFLALDHDDAEDSGEVHLNSNPLSIDVGSVSEEEEESCDHEVTMATNVDNVASDQALQLSVDTLHLNLHSFTKHVFKTMPFKLHMDNFKKSKKSKKDKSKREDKLFKDIPEVIMLDNGEEEKTSDNGLSSELNPEITMDRLYLKIDADDSRPVEVVDKGSRSDEALMKRSVLGANLEKLESAPKVYESRNSIKKRRRKQREETAGPGWYNLPKTELTEEVKRDLQVIKMRSVLDPKRHYKKNYNKDLPKYFQVGTVVAGSAEFYSSRLTKKERKKTIVDQLLTDAEFRRKNKKKYLELQKKKQSGGKLYHRKMKNKRKPSSLRT